MTVHEHALARQRAAEDERLHARQAVVRPGRLGRSQPKLSAARNRTRLRRFSRLVAVLDAAIVAAVVVGAEWVRFGQLSWVDLALGRTSHEPRSYLLITAVTIVTWVGFLHALHSYDRRFAGHGPEEYSAVARAGLFTFTGLALLSYAAKLEIARGWMLIVLPAGTLALLLVHWLMRAVLNRRRGSGDMLQTVLVVGDTSVAERLARSFEKTPGAGYRIVGVCSDGSRVADGLPVLGSQAEAPIMASRLGVDFVACAPTVTSSEVRRLSWKLEGSAAQLMIIPTVTDVSAPRVTTRSMQGSPFLLVNQPVLSGHTLVLKTFMDKVLSFGLLLVLTPLLATVALLVKLGDRGPVLFRQRRVGLNGNPFMMLKFRSMVVDAERIRETMQSGGDNPDRGPLFKVKNDPRITPLGRFIRKTSIDELPQLINVLRGEMSLVGPRPPLEKEVAAYDHEVHRRLLVKPGLTGLWQVSGRSNLTWEESVRYDLYYVENWSVMGDLMILFRTVKAVLAKDGAY